VKIGEPGPNGVGGLTAATKEKFIVTTYLQKGDQLYLAWMKPIGEANPHQPNTYEYKRPETLTVCCERESLV